MADQRLTNELFGGEFLWSESDRMSPRAYQCGFCNNKVSSNLGLAMTNTVKGFPQVFSSRGVYLCPSCGGPTFFDLNDKQVPGVLIGSSIDNIPPEIKDLYEEARRSYSVGAYTGSVLLARKMLMNIAVHLGQSQSVKEGETFKYYVDFLEQNGHVPTSTLSWVDNIRSEGNEATHKINLKSAEDAEKLLLFIEMLLKINFEYPSKI